MPIMADVTQEKQRISDQLAKIDTERSKLQDRLNELEIAERVLSRFGKQGGETQRRGRPAASQSKQASGNGETPEIPARRPQTHRPKAQLVPPVKATLHAYRAH